MWSFRSDSPRSLRDPAMVARFITRSVKLYKRCELWSAVSNPASTPAGVCKSSEFCVTKNAESITQTISFFKAPIVRISATHGSGRSPALLCEDFIIILFLLAAPVVNLAFFSRREHRVQRGRWVGGGTQIEPCMAYAVTTPLLGRVAVPRQEGFHVCLSPVAGSFFCPTCKKGADDKSVEIGAGAPQK